MKKILMLLQSPFPPDIRLEKEISSLAKNGYEVILICNQYDRNKNENFPECTIIRIKAMFKNVKLNKILNFPLFANPRFIYKSILYYRKYRPDFIHAHDLPMVPLAILLKSLFGKKVIFDMHENYPEALKEFNKKGFFNYIFKNYRFARILENYCLKRVDKVICVVEESKERLLYRGIDESKIIIVSNTVDLSTFNVDSTTKISLKEYENRFIMTYSGTVSPERDLITAVKSVSTIKNSISNLLMLIIGDGKSVPSLKKYIAEQQLETFVNLLPWVGHDKIINFIKIADICFIPQPSNEFIDTTIPHKLFEYMSLGKTVLVSDAKPFKRIIEETNCGEYFNSENSIDFGEKVIKIYNSETDYGHFGRKAVETKYNWEIDSKLLLNMYQNLT